LPITLRGISGVEVPIPTLTVPPQLLLPAMQPSIKVLLSVATELEPMAVAFEMVTLLPAPYPNMTPAPTAVLLDPAKP